jgi:hypothetical protein
MPPLATADALTVASEAPNAVDGRHHLEADADETHVREPRHRTRRHRFSHVFRTLARGLVAEHEPA